MEQERILSKLYKNECDVHWSVLSISPVTRVLMRMSINAVSVTFWTAAFYYYCNHFKQKTNFCLTLRNTMNYWLKHMLCLFMFCCSVKVELKICTTSHFRYGIKLNRAHRVMTRTLKDEAEPALHRSVSQQPIAQSVSFLSSFAAFLQPSFAVSHMTLLPQARAIISFASVSLT